MRTAGRFDMRRGVVALRNLLERDVIAGLGTDVEEREAGRSQSPQLVVGLFENVPRHRVTRHATQAREDTPGGLEDRQPVIERKDERIAVGNEELLDLVPDLVAGALNVLERVGELAHAKRLLSVHVA